MENKEQERQKNKSKNGKKGDEIQFIMETSGSKSAIPNQSTTIINKKPVFKGKEISPTANHLTELAKYVKETEKVAEYFTEQIKINKNTKVELKTGITKQLIKSIRRSMNKLEAIQGYIQKKPQLLLRQISLSWDDLTMKLMGENSNTPTEKEQVLTEINTNTLENNAQSIRTRVTQMGKQDELELQTEQKTKEMATQNCKRKETKIDIIVANIRKD